MVTGRVKVTGVEAPALDTDTTTQPGEGEGSEDMPAVGTYSLTVELDADSEVSTVRIEAMGEVRYEANYLSSYGSVQITLTGSGSEVINIYVNDKFLGNAITIYE